MIALGSLSSVVGVYIKWLRHLSAQDAPPTSTHFIPLVLIWLGLWNVAATASSRLYFMLHTSLRQRHRWAIGGDFAYRYVYLI